MKDVDIRLHKLESNVAALQGAMFSTPVGAKRARGESVAVVPPVERGAAREGAAAVVAEAAAATEAEAPLLRLRGTTEEKKKLTPLKNTCAKDQFVDLCSQDFHKIDPSKWVVEGQMNKQDVDYVKKVYKHFMFYATDEEKTWLANTSFSHTVEKRGEKLARLSALAKELDKKLWIAFEAAEGMVGKGRGKKKMFTSSVGSRLKTIKEAANKLGKPEIYNNLVQSATGKARMARNCSPYSSDTFVLPRRPCPRTTWRRRTNRYVGAGVFALK